MLIIQHIMTTWTKKSRGMPQAAQRNAIPKALRLPAQKSHFSDLFLHEVKHYEYDSFYPHSQMTTSTLALTYWDLKLHQEAEQIQINFKYPLHRTGLPIREFLPEKLFSLEINETANFQINGRFSGKDNQSDEGWYEQHSFNFAHLKHFDERVFINKEPIYRIDRLEHLF